MPKRKAKDEHTPHERPPRKKQKKVFQQDAASGKGKKTSIGATTERRETVSANWQSLRMVLYVTFLELAEAYMCVHVRVCR